MPSFNEAVKAEFSEQFLEKIKTDICSYSSEYLDNSAL